MQICAEKDEQIFYLSLGYLVPLFLIGILWAV